MKTKTPSAAKFDWIAFGEFIAQRRQSLNINQTDLALAIGRKQPDISTIERGKSRPNVDTLIRLAEALGMDPATVLARFQNKPRNSTGRQ